MDNDTIIQEIVQGDLQTLWNLLDVLKDEYPDVHEQVKHGIQLKYHIMHNLQNYARIRERNQEVSINDTTVTLEQWWDEESARKALAREVLLEHYSNTETFEAR